LSAWRRGFKSRSRRIITPTWTVFDSEQQDFVEVKAENWKEATVKAMDKGIKPRRHLDVRPRTGDSPKYPCTPKKEFNEFMRN